MRETWIMAALCMIDLVWTLWVIGAKLAVEANPVMLALLQHGVGWFIAFKCAYTFGPLILLEMVRRRHQDVVRRYLRFGIVLYAGSHAASLFYAFCAIPLLSRG